MWNAERKGSAGGAEAPHRVDPHNVHTRTRIDGIEISQDGMSMPSWLKTAAAPQKRSRSTTLDVGVGGTTHGQPRPLAFALGVFPLEF